MAKTPTGHTFPNITPSQRVYTLERSRKREFQGLNGAVTILQFGAKTVDSKLEMTFQNITDSEAEDILDNYKAVNGGRDDFGRQDYVELPDSNSGAVKGVEDGTLRLQMAERQSGPKLRYRYASPPVITSTFPGTSQQVQVSLRWLWKALVARPKIREGNRRSMAFYSAIQAALTSAIHITRTL